MSIFEPWWVIWVALAISVIVIAIAASVAAGPNKNGNIDVRVTLVVAAVWSGFALLGGIINSAVALFQEQFSMVVPVAPFWPQLPDSVEIEEPTATMWTGEFTQADVLVSGVSFGVRALWSISTLLAWVIPAIIAAMIAIACFQLLAGRAFAPVVSRMLMITAVVVAVGGVAAAVTGDIAGSMASEQLFSWTGAKTPVVEGIADVMLAWMPRSTFSVTIPLLPIAGGLAFAALASIFRYGNRLQRDTEGLV